MGGTHHSTFAALFNINFNDAKEDFMDWTSLSVSE